MNRVAILAFNGVSLLELSIAAELFILPRPNLPRWYSAKIVSFEVSPLKSDAGIFIDTPLLHSFEGFDCLVVPSWPTDGPPAKLDLALALLEFAGKKNKRILSFSTGAFLLAELGIFKNRVAVTHWQHADLFKTRFPDVDVDDDALYLFDGQVGCSGAGATAFDLGLEVIRSDFGVEAANEVAAQLVVSAHRSGYQSEFSENTASRHAQDFADTLNWAQKNIAFNLSVDALAEHAKMSRRSFDRRFKDEFSLTPHEWLTQQKMKVAQSLLERSQHSIDYVAEKSGFANALSLRDNFKKRLGMSPTEYRNRHYKK